MRLIMHMNVPVLMNLVKPVYKALNIYENMQLILKAGSKVWLRKCHTLENAIVPNQNVPDGDTREGVVCYETVIPGNPVLIQTESRYFRTSVVVGVEQVDGKTYIDTYNSRYEIVVTP